VSVIARGGLAARAGGGAEAPVRARTDAQLLTQVRSRLLLLSGGLTLLILLVLGATLYWTVANSLATASTEQLRDRAAMLQVKVIGMPGPGLTPSANAFVTTFAGAPGLVIGGPTSGTLAYVVPPEAYGQVMMGSRVVDQLATGVDPAAIETVRSGVANEIVSETTYKDTPYRVLSAAVDAPDGRYVTQVVADRTAEVRTLQVLLVVLIGGGALALLAALGLGWLYAERALVPIRDSLRRQREFAADASHELRTPLAVLRSSAEHLRRHRDAPVASVGTAVTDIELEVERMTALVDDLLLLARTDSGAVELTRAPVDLADVATDATGRLAGVAGDAGVRLLLDAEPVVVDGDRARLEQLLGILLANAVRHSPRGTEVTVAVARDGRDARLAVLDRGHGIEPSDLPRVFDRFWRAPEAPDGGTGLGLAIAAWIAQHHGGSVEAANRPDGGARFEVRLPAV
jgi:signal transduction histidine kinase